MKACQMLRPELRNCPVRLSKPAGHNAFEEATGYTEFQVVNVHGPWYYVNPCMIYFKKVEQVLCIIPALPTGAKPNTPPSLPNVLVFAV